MKRLKIPNRTPKKTQVKVNVPNVRIALDQSSVGFAGVLSNYGYDVVVYKDIESQNDIHRKANRENIGILITSEHEGFAHRQGAKYALIEISQSLLSNNPIDILAKAVACYLSKLVNYILSSKWSYFRCLTADDLQSVGCTMIKRELYTKLPEIRTFINKNVKRLDYWISGEKYGIFRCEGCAEAEVHEILRRRSATALITTSFDYFLRLSDRTYALVGVGLLVRDYNLVLVGRAVKCWLDLFIDHLANEKGTYAINLTGEILRSANCLNEEV